MRKIGEETVEFDNIVSCVFASRMIFWSISRAFSRRLEGTCVLIPFPWQTVTSHIRAFSQIIFCRAAHIAIHESDGEKYRGISGFSSHVCLNDFADLLEYIRVSCSYRNAKVEMQDIHSSTRLSPILITNYR